MSKKYRTLVQIMSCQEWVNVNISQTKKILYEICNIVQQGTLQTVLHLKFVFVKTTTGYNCAGMFSFAQFLRLFFWKLNILHDFTVRKIKGLMEFIGKRKRKKKVSSGYTVFQESVCFILQCNSLPNRLYYFYSLLLQPLYSVPSSHWLADAGNVSG